MLKHSMSVREESITPFKVKDCALIALATGKRARTLKGVRDYLENIDPESIYYHFWGSLLRPRFEDPEYHNDFAGWAAHGLNDKTAAERLGIVDPMEYESVEDLRAELIDIIDERIDELEMLPAATRDKQFEFINSSIVVFATRRVLKKPEDLGEVISNLSPGSIFYHFIDARRRTSKSQDDFTAWLENFDGSYQAVIDGLAEIDPYFGSLTTLRDDLSETFAKHLKGNS